ncbi:MAG: BamA/TamA family outer membrane protein [Candidatus Moduliflexus flocculans]|nr:BamA/TamA family outer membrane protein [Candidatus Moduliflexus flocculans]
MAEGEIAYLNRLEFRGNNYTKDKVIRREMMLREGDRFSLAMFKNSILRIKQLGLVDLEKDPDIKPDPTDPTKMDVQVNVKELQRNNIQFTAGYSGYEGTFVAFSYSTVNFLGAGETLELGIQQGKLVKNYSFGFSEPYVFDKPITAGFNVYKRDLHYPWFWRKGAGIDLSLGARLWGMWRANLVYNFENVKMTVSDSEEFSLPTSYYMYYSNRKYNMSSVTPMLYRSTIDSPLTPTRGTLYSAALKYALPFLGGDVFLLKPMLEFTHYQPVIGRGAKAHVIGVHAQYQVIKALKGSQIPYWERIVPRRRAVHPRLRGLQHRARRRERLQRRRRPKSLVLNAEYIIPVGGPLYAIFFYDRGNAVAYEDKLRWGSMYSSMGLEARLFIPALRVPFRLIFSYNNKKVYSTDPDFAFRFAVGTTF